MSNEFESDDDFERRTIDDLNDDRTHTYCEGESKDRYSPGFDLVGHNLGRYRFYGPILTRAEERDLIRRAQAGCAISWDRLIRAYARTVLKLSGKYHGKTRDDLAAAGFAGLIEAIKRFNLSERTGLRACADTWIRNAIREETKGGIRSDKDKQQDRLDEGQIRGTRADRVLHSNPSLIDNPNIPNPVERLAEMAGVKPKRAAEAIAVYRAANYQEHYSTTGAADDGDGTRGWDYGSDKPDKFQNPVPVELPADLGVISQYSRRMARGHGDGRWWRISRNERVFGSLPGILPTYSGYCERRELALLKALGRQRYADELVERDNRKIKDSDDHPARCFPYGRTGAVKPLPMHRPFVQLLQKKRNHALRRIEVRTKPGREYLGPVHFKWTDEKNARLMAARLSKIPTPQVRHLDTEKKCHTFANHLQTRRHERHYSPSPRALPKRLPRSSRLA
jgi:hypothetical protein